MGDLVLNEGSDLKIESSDLSQNSKVIANTVLAGICAAICVFSSIVAFFFAGWFRLSSDAEIACWMTFVILEYRTFIDDGIFLNLFVLSIACFAGYLFTGSLNKWVGIIPLLLAVFFGFLYLITMLPPIIGVGFLPSIFYWNLFGDITIKDIPYLIWFILTIMVIPIIYLIGTLQAKTIPAWKTLVLIAAAFFVFVFLLVSFIKIGLSGGSYSFVMSRGMAFWILFAIIIFSELIRTRAKKIYVWLTVILSTGAVVLSLILTFGLYFVLYQKTIDYKNANKGKDRICNSYKNF